MTPRQLAAHGQLYEFISFTNAAQWTAVNARLWNVYRVASQGNNRARQAQALEDILMLPQRTLTRTSRGAGDGQRLTSIIKGRCRDLGIAIRQQYGCMPVRDNNVKLDLVTEQLSHVDVTGPESKADASTADTDVDDSDAETIPPTQESIRAEDAEEEEEEEEEDDDYSGTWGSRTHAAAADADRQAAKRAQHHVRHGHLSKAAQTLYSVTELADLRRPENQQTMRDLHPPLPQGSVLPSLPQHAPEMVLEDDAVMHALLRRSNNGSASGPSGWGGNMLSMLVESDVCRAGIITLLKDIINGNLPDSARQLLLASRAIGLGKPDNGIRPIAIGELFYRLAGVIAVRKIAMTAGKLLAPHQFGVGVANGAERILHSLQHALTDKDTKTALLKLDISNAFNSCDRARVLQRLYATPELSSLYRLADFGYSAPSELLLQGCEGQSILSSNGVRQGDPLSAVLFCLYLRDVLARVSQAAKVRVYAFFDDVNVEGAPAEVMKALGVLKQMLADIALKVNTSKSHFAYFHGDEEPLPRSILQTLADNDIQRHERHFETVGAVIGCDDDAIREGLDEMIAAGRGRDAFFTRVQLGELSVQSSMLLLRQCAVPQLNYLLRCTPPPCVKEQATAFDALVQQAALDKLAIHKDDLTATATRLLQAPLRHGGFGMSAAARTSHAAYLGSLAAVADVPVFAGYRRPDTLPDSLPLHGWIAGSMRAVLDECPEAEEHLPSTAASFVHHFANASSTVASSLQRTLSTLATKHQFNASLSAARGGRRMDGGASLAHLLAISAKRACAWKTVMPSTEELALKDDQYRLAARLNLGLPPMAPGALPKVCPSCNTHDSLSADPWHFLTCAQGKRGEIEERHNAVADAIYRTVLAVGGQAVREPRNLEAADGRRPDLKLVLGLQKVLVDVVVSHPLTPAHIRRREAWRMLGVARGHQRRKHLKYDRMAARNHAQMLAFSVETCGGMASDAETLLQLVAKLGEEGLALWPKEAVLRELIGAVSIAVQRGTAMSFLSGYTRAMLLSEEEEEDAPQVSEE